MKVFVAQRPFLSLSVAAAAFVPLPAWAGEAVEPGAQPGERSFGDAGELAISGATQFRLDHSWSWFGNAEFQEMTLTANGAVDYFVWPGLSLGASFNYLGYDNPDSPGSTGNSLSFGPRVGYNVPLARQWSLWPDVHGGYHLMWSGNIGPGHTLDVGVYVPVLYHPAPHFFIGLGPEALTIASFNQTTGGSQTTVGLSVTVGGWIGI